RSVEITAKSPRPASYAKLLSAKLLRTFVSQQLTNLASLAGPSRLGGNLTWICGHLGSLG
ncbi:MAG TPA: hypothetical protein VFP47_02025, partial [Pyrinomonadaceae bacterium]|nr:hypothetical protein [Pyrinomonadaceae bacterium]